MTPAEFKQLIEEQSFCPESLPTPLQGLWYDKKGDWDTAHKILGDATDTDSAWVHAYLHRKEGDLANTRYWYGRSGKPEFKGELDREWEQIVSELLKKVS